MKKIILGILILASVGLIAAILIAADLISISNLKSAPTQTIENLKAAIEGESNASAMYKAFSAKAAEEGFSNIAKMFEAAAEAEAVHVKNHNAVLVKLGEPEYKPEIKTPEVGDTQANLKTAIEGETYEYTKMYPGFIVKAKAEKSSDALKSFTWARDAEFTHAQLYSKALKILSETGSDETVSSAWFICLKCGDLFDSVEDLKACPLCGTNPTLFLKF